MKGFKPTGYGPTAGFKYPSSMGFKGSTGAYTNVSPYVRRKGYANGGFVREDNPRMKEATIGDQGSALIRRARSSNNLDQESGGKTPIRPGYKKGGKAKRMHKADGGGVKKRSNLKGFWASVADVPALMKEGINYGTDAIKRKMTGGERTVEGRNQSVDEYTAQASRYSRGGKTKRMGYARGGLASMDAQMMNRVGMSGPQRMQAAPPAPAPMPRPGGHWAAGTTRATMNPPAPMVTNRMVGRGAPAMAMRSKGGKAKRMAYAKGGGVSVTQAKKIAERTVGDHVRYPAPKGHKGFEKVIAQRR